MFFKKNTFPRQITLDISSSCNLKCQMCSLEDNYDNKSFMSLETFEKIIPIIPKLDYIDLNCNAEPLMNKNLIRILKTIKHVSPKTKVGFPTNGVLLNEKIIRELITNNLDVIRFSINGATKETFESIRTKADFNKVIFNVDLFSKVKKQLKKDNLILVLTFVAMRRNISELPDLIDLSKSLGIAEVSVLGLEPYTLNMSKEALYVYDSEIYQNYFSLSKKKAEKNSIHLQLPALSSNKNERCLFNDTLYITAEGDVVPCPLLSYNRTFYYFGNKLWKRYNNTFFH